MRKILMGVVVIICLLTGCQQAPEQVQERMNSDADMQQMQETDCTYCTVEELKNISIDMVSYKPGNISLPDKIDFSDLEAVGTVTFQAQENYMDKREEIAEYFGVDNPRWEFYEESTNWCQYDGEKETLVVDDNGEWAYECGRLYQSVLQDTLPRTVKKLHLNREDITGIECRFDGKMESLENSIAYANQWLNRCKYINHDFDYKLRTIYVREYPDGENHLSMLYQMMYKGVGLSYITYGMLVDGQGEVIINAINSDVEMDMENSSTVTGFTISNHVNVIREEMVSEVIDFESALRLVEEKMAGFSKLNVAEVRIEYVLEPQYDTSRSDNAYSSGVVMEARPVYAFWIPHGGSDDSDYGICESNEMVYIYVDMLDGTVTDDFEPYSYHGE